MKAYLSILSGCSLFRGLTGAELTKLLACMHSEPKFAPEGSILLREGDELSSVILLLDGSVGLSRPTFSGRESFARVSPGGIIGLESVFLAERIDFTAAADCDVVYLALDGKRLIETCPSSCEEHNRVTRNVVRMLAETAVRSSDRTVHLTRRTTREKLMSYLMSEAARTQSRTFEIPFDRQSLADYLAVDRSAMSSELSRMRSEGLIDYSRSKFTLN